MLPKEWRKPVHLPLGEGSHMSWCNKLASVPTVGLTLDYHFVSSAELLNVLSTALLDKLVKNDKPTFTLERQHPFEITVTTEDGFQYGIGPAQISVGFIHRMRARPTSGGPLVMEMLSQAAPYTDLLARVTEQLIETTLLLPEAKTRNVKRFGIVTTTRVAEDEMPPGISRFIAYVGRPWQRQIDTYAFQITSELAASGTAVDRCIHAITKPEDRDELPTIAFDWQRTFTPGLRLARETLIEMSKRATESALAYFEDIAEGKRFDEDIIRSTT
jgi:hypothetical protein